MIQEADFVGPHNADVQRCGAPFVRPDVAAIANCIHPDEPEADIRAVAETLGVSMAPAALALGLAGGQEKSPRRICRIERDIEALPQGRVELGVGETPLVRLRSKYWQSQWSSHGGPR
jgi:hypothetical protein